MTITELLLPEIEQELGTTRRVIERVPNDKLAWKPHDKSWSMAQLGSHVVSLLTWGETTMNKTEFDVASVPSDQMNPVATSSAQMLEWLDKNGATLRTVVRRPDSDYFVPWTLKHNGHEILTLPRYTCMRSFVLNHLVHHRGQLSVYLRLTGVPVPAMYGPSADEQQ